MSHKIATILLLFLISKGCSYLLSLVNKAVHLISSSILGYYTNNVHIHMLSTAWKSQPHFTLTVYYKQIVALQSYCIILQLFSFSLGIVPQFKK